MPAKVLHIITKLEFGGAQGNTIYTVSHLNRDHFEAKLVTGRGGVLDRRTAPGSVIYAGHLTRSIRPAEDLLAVLELINIIKKERPSIVHTHSSKAGIVGRLAARLAGVPVVIHTFHGFGFHERQNPLKRWFFILLEKLCAALSDALIFVSRANMDYAINYHLGNEKKYSLIRSGIPLRDYPDRSDRAAKRRELGVPQNAVLIVSLGNLKPQKNPSDFMAAARRIAAARPDTVFMLVGGGDGLEDFRAMAAAAGLGERLLFPGWREDSAAILAASDIFALTSLWEGLPRSLVEAIRTGLPSVCYRTDGVADLLYDGANGYAVKPGDIDAFCMRLQELIDNPGMRSDMAARAAGTDLSDFDIDYMVRQQEALYAGLLRGKGIIP